MTAEAVKGYCGKKTSRYPKHLGDAVLANCIRMFLCILIGFVIAVVLFREKLSIKAVIGICTAFAGIIMINLL